MIVKIIQGKYSLKKQSGKPSYFKRRKPDQSELKDLNNSKKYLYDFIRMLSDPYPNAFCFYNEVKIFLKKATLCEEDFRGPPGRICKMDNEGIVVTCGKDYSHNQGLLITEISDGKKIINPKEFFGNLWQILE